MAWGSRRGKLGDGRRTGQTPEGHVIRCARPGHHDRGLRVVPGEPCRHNAVPRINEDLGPKRRDPHRSAVDAHFYAGSIDGYPQRGDEPPRFIKSTLDAVALLGSLGWGQRFQTEAEMIGRGWD
jgi:hypothetical protein